MCLTFTITITKCFFSKDPNDYIVDNLFHQWQFNTMCE
jgi:hypothetical protein